MSVPQATVDAAPPLRVGRASASPAEWDRFTRAAAGSTFCHMHGWSDVLAETLAAEPHFMEARDEGGVLCGVLPLYRVRSVLLGDYLVSVPFLNYGGPLGDAASRTALANAAVETARELGVDSLELRSREREKSRLAPVDRKILVELELPHHEDALWSAFPSKLRSQIRRPTKEGLTTDAGAGQVRDFYRVFAENMRDLGTPVLPLDFFLALPRTFGDAVSFVTVRSGDEVVAAGCGFFHGDEFEITWASTLRRFNRFSPNMLLYWELMRRAIERGSRRFNFGRCSPGGGTHRFKRQWGGDDVPLGWSGWAPGDAPAMPSPDRPLFSLATRVWSRMPLWATNRLGPRLARALP